MAVVVIGALLLIIDSCSVTKYVPEGEYLLDKTSIHIEDDSTLITLKHANLDLEDMQGVLKQRPNRKVLGSIRFYLWLYNLSNQKRIDKRKIIKEEKAKKKNQRIDKKNEKKREKIERKNERRKEKAEKKGEEYVPVTFHPIPHVDPKLTFGERLREAGEAPVILDSLKAMVSAKQLNIYLINKGYFNNRVRFTVKYYPDTIVVNGKTKIKHKRKAGRAEVNYQIRLGKPYRINQITYNVPDTGLLFYIDSIKQQSLLKTGDIYDSDKLGKERERITDFLLNNGYRFFNKEFIFFKVDSNLNAHKVNIEMGVQNYKQKDPVYDTIIEKKHTQYNIMKIEIYPDYSVKAKPYEYKDTLIVNNDIKIISRHRPDFNIDLLLRSIKFSVGDLYRKDRVVATYKTYSSLGVFRSTSIVFDTINNGCNDLVAKIKLQPTKMQTFTVATDGTHRNGLLGVQGRLAYTNRNIFRGAEKLQISLNGGLEMQRLLVEEDANNTIEDATNISNTFNTLTFGPRVSLLFPTFLFFHKYFPYANNPKTELVGVVNYQRRPDFTRNKQNFSFGYVWHEKKPITYRFTPFNINAIKIEKSDAFEQKIQQLNDRLLASSYQDHIIASSLFSVTYNGEKTGKKRNYIFSKTSLETAGNSLRAFYSLTKQPLNEQGYYEFLGIRFAQFVKISSDFRYYNNITRKVRVVSRVAGGFGIPLQNLKEALPFEKSFYSGGANGIRAWKARTLGPGSYYDSTKSFDKIGDIQMEGNLELRFPISGWIEGATFLDAGNIWLLHEDSLRPGAKFNPETFLSEIAFGTGAGIRLDLDFFILRFDFAIPIKNPALPVGERWILQGKWKEEASFQNGVARRDFFPWQFNLGIGYPF